MCRPELRLVEKLLKTALGAAGTCPRQAPDSETWQSLLVPPTEALLCPGQVRTASCAGSACLNSFGDEQLAVDLLADKLLFEALKYSVSPPNITYKRCLRPSIAQAVHGAPRKLHPGDPLYKPPVHHLSCIAHSSVVDATLRRMVCSLHDASKTAEGSFSSVESEGIVMEA